MVDSVIRGETVVVLREVEIGRDPFDAPIVDWVDELVPDVLVAPGARGDVVDSNRPDGVEVQWTLHFPKTFKGSLRGAEVSVRGQAPCPVIGDPQPYTDENTPTRWNRPVEVSRVDG